MSNQLNKIKELIPYLPGKDKEIANKLLSKRDFEGLKDLTLSSFIIMERKFDMFENIPEKYKNVDLDKLRDLAIICSDFYYQLFPEDLVEEVQDVATDYTDNY